MSNKAIIKRPPGRRQDRDRAAVEPEPTEPAEPADATALVAAAEAAEPPLIAGSPSEPHNDTDDSRPHVVPIDFSINLLPYPETDSGNASRFVALYKDSACWCEPWKSWLNFDRCWKRAEKLEPVNLAKVTLHRTRAQAEKMNWKTLSKYALESENRCGINALLDLAKPDLAVTPDQFDVDGMLLNTLSGTVELSTGRLREHRPSDYIMKLAPVEFNPDASCRRWLEFLCTLTDGSIDLVSYLQTALGMSLIAGRHKILFACIGPGDTGKTTLLQLIRRLTGNYSAQVKIDSLMMDSRRDNNVQEDIADLRGARFVTTSECRSGQQLDAATVKNLTGGERLKVARKYEHTTEFDPTHTLFLDGNFRPGVDGSEEAIWNRLKLIPFRVQIPKDQQNPSLIDELVTEEGPGILAWLVEGCLTFQRTGLIDCQEVIDATNAWRLESDTFLEFIEDKCILGLEHVCKSDSLYKWYVGWAGGRGEKYPMSQTAFQERICKIQGVKKAVHRFPGNKQARAFLGIDVKRERIGCG